MPPIAAQYDVERTAWLLERLSREFGREIDRGGLRRSLEESRVSWGQSIERSWSQPFVEAADGQGLRCRVIECGIEDLTALLQDGAWLIVATQSRGIVAVSKGSRGRFTLVAPSGNHPVTSQDFEHELAPVAVAGGYRCLLVEPHETHSEESTRTPFARLYALLLPELGDIWTVAIFAMVTGLLALATPLAVEALVNTVAFGKLFQPVVILSLMLLAFLAFAAALKGLQTFVVEILQRRLFARVASDVAYRLPRARVQSLDGIESRELVNRFLEIVTVQKIAAQFLLDGISLVMGTIIGMSVLAFYHPWLLGFDLVLLALIAFGILILGRGAVYTSIKESKTKYHTLAWLEEVAASPLAFRIGGAQQFALERTDQLIFEYLQARKKHFVILMRQIVFALGLQALASTILLGLGGWLVINQQLSLGQLVAAELIVATIVGAFAKLGKHMEAYYDLMASVDKLGALFDLPIEDQNGLLSFPAHQPAEVDVNHVSYSMKSGGSVLSNAQLHLESGARAVLQGPSGSGKSLLMDLLFGIRQPNSGHVTMGGIDQRDFRPDVLRRHVALVRDIEVFEATVAENVHLGRPEISLADIRQALADVGLLDEILMLEDGLKSHLGPQGSPLTSNQLRRLMLARAIVGRPRLLLIDGLLDGLPDTISRDLISMLKRSDQPWTLLLVTGHEQLRQGLRTVSLVAPGSQGRSSDQEATHHGS